MYDLNSLSNDEAGLFIYLRSTGYCVYRPGLQSTRTVMEHLVTKDLVSRVINPIAGEGYIISPVYVGIKEYRKCVAVPHIISLLKMMRTGRYDS